MFGENVIILNRQLKLDPKRRITIPQKTGIEVGEDIYPIFSLKKEYLRLFNLNDFNRIAENFEEILLNLRNEGKINAYQMRQYRRYFYASLCFAQEKADKQHRIILDERIIDILGISDTIYVVGNGNHLDVYKDKETYQKILSIRK